MTDRRPTEWAMREALNVMLDKALGAKHENKGIAFMSIPVRPECDSDIILSDAIDELVSLRTENERLRKDAERWRWFFGNRVDRGDVLGYLQGCSERWSTDQWRAWADAAMAREREGGE